MCLLVMSAVECGLVCLGHRESDPSSALQSQDNTDHNFGDRGFSGVFPCHVRSLVTGFTHLYASVIFTRLKMCICWCL